VVSFTASFRIRAITKFSFPYSLIALFNFEVPSLFNASLKCALYCPSKGPTVIPMAKVITGVTFKDGIETTDPDQIAA